MMKNVVKILLLFVFASFIACTDYEDLIEEEYQDKRVSEGMSIYDCPVEQPDLGDVIIGGDGFRYYFIPDLPYCFAGDNEPYWVAYVDDSQARYVCYNGVLYTAICDGGNWKTVTDFSGNSSVGCDSVSYDTKTQFCDARDGEIYKFVTIGSQVWMAEDLRYGRGVYYGWDEDTCSRYAHTYSNWSEALEACPAGWHLPTINEWYTLISSVTDSVHDAWYVLESTSGWIDQYGDQYGNGSDYYGFSIYPTGANMGRGVCLGNGRGARYWSSSEYNDLYSYTISLYEGLSLDNVTSKNEMYDTRIRCVKGDVQISSSTTKDECANKSFDSSKKFCDSRDGKIYRFTNIGQQTWMAENLNYEIEDFYSHCYSNISANCDKYGREYTWASAIGEPENKCGKDKGCRLPEGNIQGICPKGWHLPSADEWRALVDGIGGDNSVSLLLAEKADDVCWRHDIYSGSGLGDPLEFSAKDCQLRYWSSTADSTSASDAYYWDISHGSDLYTERKEYFFPVRCLKDEPYIAPSSTKSCAEKSIDSKKEFCDSRDGKVYKYVTIGSQKWMAENLNYESDGSYYYNDSKILCDVYGRLYTWSAVDEACPSDWHLPSDAEWGALVEKVGGESVAGKALKSKSGWLKYDEYDETPGNGEDTFGFSAIAAGYRDGNSTDERYSRIGNYVAFWSSTLSESQYRSYWDLRYSRSSIYRGTQSKDGAFAYSVRCVHD